MVELGTEKIEKELDITKFLKSQMLFKVLIKAQFSKMERFLARRQHKGFVLDRSDSNSSDSFSNFDNHSGGES